jgi:hypothetical protein
MTKDVQNDFLIQNAVDKMTKYLIEDFNLNVVDAMNVIYNSEVFRLLHDKKTELFIQSPAYIYELLKNEYLTGKMA